MSDLHLQMRSHKYFEELHSLNLVLLLCNYPQDALYTHPWATLAIELQDPLRAQGRS